ncbi:MAG TPA: YafY family protein [Chloroflexia bacterium]|nr:YafY family protein [Chloroflexia bacterium]
MRADRLLSILMLLQVKRHQTAREIARRLEVSERTVHRDMEALSAAGIPVVAERGTGGGWRLLESYQTNLNGLNLAEINSLFLSQPDQLLADLGLNQASEAALLKLLAALPTVQRQTAEYARQRIYIDSGGWNEHQEATTMLPVLQDAVWQERKVSMLYRRNDETAVERVIDPLGLVAKGTVWYLVGAVEGEIRSYRVSRVEKATLLEESCQRPAEFDLAAYWKESASQFRANLPVYYATLRVRQAMVPRLRYNVRYARIEKIEEPLGGEWAKVTIRFQSEGEACEYVSGFGPDMLVVEPASLREKVVKQAEELLKLYSQTAIA